MSSCVTSTPSEEVLMNKRLQRGEVHRPRCINISIIIFTNVQKMVMAAKQ